MKIGLLAADLAHTHGWAHYSLSVLEALNRAGVECVVLCAANTPRETIERLTRDGIDARAVLPNVDPMARGMLLHLIRWLPTARAAFRGCTVIHSLIEPYAPLAAWVAGRRPLIVTAHGSYVRVDRAWRPPTRAIQRWALRRARLACVSHYTANAARHALGDAVQTVVIPNGVDGARFARLRRAPVDPPLVLFVGAVKRRKGVLSLVRAMAGVRAAIPDVQCAIVGSTTQEPTYVATVRAMITALDLEDTIVMPGRVSDADLLGSYAAASVFALPSIEDDWKFEGFGLAILEASAAGLPVIGARECGAEDAIDHEVTGLLVPPGDEEAIAAALIDLLRDPGRAAARGAAGRAKAAAMTWDAAAAQLIGVYQDLPSP